MTLRVDDNGNFFTTEPLPYGREKLTTRMLGPAGTPILSMLSTTRWHCPSRNSRCRASRTTACTLSGARELAGRANGDGFFKPPPLRNVIVTGACMHDGSLLARRGCSTTGPAEALLTRARAFRSRDCPRSAAERAVLLVFPYRHRLIPTDQDALVRAVAGDGGERVPRPKCAWRGSSLAPVLCVLRSPEMG